MKRNHTPDGGLQLATQKEQMNTAQDIKKRFLTGCEKRFKKTYSFLKGKKVWIYGSARYGRFLAKALVDYGCVEKADIQAFINDFESGVKVDGIPVVNLEDCVFANPDSIVVVAIENNRSVIECLREREIAFFSDTTAGRANMAMPLMWSRVGRPICPIGDLPGKIDRYYELGLGEKRGEMEALYSDQESLAVLRNRLAFYETGRAEWLEKAPIEPQEYFGNGALSLSTDEVYIDLGAYTGDSVLAFTDCVRGMYRKIVAFEPDMETFRKLKKNTASLENVELVEAATGAQNGEVSFSDGQGECSAISKTGTKTVRLVRLDDFLSEPPTLVKMDIEGAELETLKGMERIIRGCHPKLIVCVYHKVEDLYEIPNYLKRLVPEYRFKLRQHEASIYQTVLYAEI